MLDSGGEGQKSTTTGDGDIAAFPEKGDLFSIVMVHFFSFYPHLRLLYLPAIFQSFESEIGHLKEGYLWACIGRNSGDYNDGQGHGKPNEP